MTTVPAPTPVVAGPSAADGGLLGLAVAGHLARYKGASRSHTDADLRMYLTWCAERGLDSFLVRRLDVELYVRWLQEARRLQPSTVSRRLSVVIGFYRTCVIDSLIEHSPADYVRRPTVPPESPTLGLSHLQFEAMLSTARLSSNSYDFALVATPGSTRHCKVANSRCGIRGWSALVGASRPVAGMATGRLAPWVEMVGVGQEQESLPV